MGTNWPAVKGHIEQSPEEGAGAFFTLLRSQTRSQKKRRKREDKKERIKVKAPSAKEKKGEFVLFSPTQGGKQGSFVRCPVQNVKETEGRDRVEETEGKKQREG